MQESSTNVYPPSQPKLNNTQCESGRQNIVHHRLCLTVTIRMMLPLRICIREYPMVIATRTMNMMPNNAEVMLYATLRS